MAYLVSLTARAQRDLILLFDEIGAEDSRTARKWYEGLKKAILSLEEMPSRCPAAPENSRIRHLLYGRKPHVYRILFRVAEHRNEVQVLHVRHGARKAARTSELR